MNRLCHILILWLLICLVSCEDGPTDVIITNRDEGMITGVVSKYSFSIYGEHNSVDVDSLQLQVLTNCTVGTDVEDPADAEEADNKTTTTSTGQYALTGIPIGLHDIVVCGNNRTGKVCGVLVEKDQTSYADIRAYEEGSYRIDLQVFLNGIPAPGVTVDIYIDNHNDFGETIDPYTLTTASKADGAVRCLLNLSQASWVRLTASKSGYTSKSKYFYCPFDSYMLNEYHQMVGQIQLN